MQRSKLTLIIDGNWLLMSRLAVLRPKYEGQELHHELNLLMSKSIMSVINYLPDIDNIVLVADGGSWRNKIDVPDFLVEAGIEYKGNRVKEEDFDWDSLFESYENYLSLLKDNNINIFREQGIEGDDWMWYLSKKLNREGTNCVIWTKDADIKQLVNFDDNFCFTVWWNKDSGIVCRAYQEDDDIDFLLNFAKDENKRLFNSLVDKSSKCTPINPMQICVDKIIRGDAGDNILPIITKIGKTGREYRIPASDIDASVNIWDQTEVDDYINTLLNSPKFKNKVTKDFNTICEHFKYNRKLVVMDNKEYPQSVKTTFKAYDNYNIVPNKDINTIFNILNANQNSLTDILEII